MVPKPNSEKLRLVLNLKKLNSFIPNIHFKMETVQDLKDLILEGDWMFKMDLKDAYLHMRVRSSFQKFLLFIWKGNWFLFSSLIFGHKLAPLFWTKIMKVPVAFLRSLGVRCVLYIDDLIFLFQGSKAHAQACFDWILRFFQLLGFQISWEKCVRRATKNLEFLGFIVDSQTLTFSLPARKVKAIKEKAKLFKKREFITPRLLASVIDKIVAASQAILPTRLRTRALFLNLHSTLRALRNWDAPVKVSPEAHFELTFWISQISRFN
jgi:hypothetical protein